MGHSASIVKEDPKSNIMTSKDIHNFFNELYESFAIRQYKYPCLPEQIAYVDKQMANRPIKEFNAFIASVWSCLTIATFEKENNGQTIKFNILYCRTLRTQPFYWSIRINLDRTTPNPIE